MNPQQRERLERMLAFCQRQVRDAEVGIGCNSRYHATADNYNKKHYAAEIARNEGRRALFRLDVEALETALQPTIDLNGMWEALKLETAATKPTDKEWANVSRLVMVSKQQVKNAFSRVTGGKP